MIELLAQHSDSDFQSVLQTLEPNTLEPNTLGVVMILVVVGVFASLIAIGCTLIDARKKVKLARIQKETIDELLNRGYGLEDVERIVHGQTGWDKFCGIFSKSEKTPTQATYRQPMPPNKHPV